MNRPWVQFIVLAAFSSVLGSGGCGRTPPAATRTPAPKAARSPDELLVSAEASAPGRLPPGSSRPILRDEAVTPASLQLEVVPKSEQQLAADALTRIGPPAVPLLVETLRGSDDEARREACAVLMRMGPDAKEAVPDLVVLLGDRDEELRRMAAVALGRIGPDAGAAAPALMRTLLDRAPQPAQ